MAIVYRVLADPQEFQDVQADDYKTVSNYPFDGSKLRQIWRPPNVYVPYPTKPAPDFWSCFSYNSVFAVTEEAAKKIVTFLDQSCEALPLHLDNRKLLVCNVTEVLNCLDKKKSRHKPGMPDWIDEYVFHRRRFQYSLFKIPDTRMSEVLCVEGLVAPEDEFKGTIEQHGLTGLRFQKLWSDEE